MSKSSTSGSLLFFFVKFIVLVTVLVWAWWMYGMPAYARGLATVCPSIIEFVYGDGLIGAVGTWEEATSGAETDLFNTKFVLMWYPEDWVEGDDTPPFLYIAKLVTNLPSFLALVLATPALGLWRRLRILLLGSAVLMATHVAFLVYAYKYVGVGEGGEIAQAASEFFLTLPFLLWIVLAYWHKLSGYFASSPETSLGSGDFELSGAKLLPDDGTPQRGEDSR